jgi:Protein of unknown function (DUF1697)
LLSISLLLREKRPTSAEWGRHGAFCCFLRGINLGKRRPPVSQLKELFEEMGLDEVETFQNLTSSNVETAAMVSSIQATVNCANFPL